ncbi:amidohydrolase family protein [Wenzhouxiangella sp. AB-CW3]|uniref:amidohydrolase family protein n=1 Tax=Wenzhouxiangella sp. AB-CW3 TaxID=2771012 RepID=UPI00168AD189|nr:amidohydrolase family protein [Wenzhouxiangella sp. AB-CW3]QOC23926.1 amidohydrolase family protein [Wenzhouxiangella sp. AB-CW3]
MSRIAIALLLASGLAGPLKAETVAYVGATVHPVSGDAIEDGILLVRDGRIEDIGADVEIPDDARTEDLSGLHLYPGLIHAGTVLGLTEISSVPGTQDTTEMGQVNAAIRAEVAVNHDSMLFAPNVAGGLLTAHVVPQGGLIRGTSAAISLSGWNWEEMTLAAPVGMHVAFPRSAAENEDDDDLSLIDEVLDQARSWSRAMTAWRDGNASRPRNNDQYAALEPVLEGEVPVFLHTQGERDMNAALDWANRQGFERIVLVGGPDLQHLADRLALEDIPAILNSVYTMPPRAWEPYDEAYVAASNLAEAGVRFAITDGGSAFNAGNARHITFQAGMAAAFGLDSETALKTVTLWPAEIIGMGEELGSLETGKRATFFAATGDALEVTTQIQRAWIDGEEYDLSRDRQRQLYERYRERPRR